MWFRSPAWDAVTYWALDLETGGVDPATDAIIAVGMVPVRGGAVHLGEAWRTLVRPDGAVTPASMRAHQLVPSELADAPPLAAVVGAIAERLDGAALLVHFAALDLAFLRQAFRASGRAWPRPPLVDTVRLLERLAHARRFLDGEGAAPPTLNLGRARAALGLPDYAAHDALLDAIATAELFLVLRSRLDARTLRQLRA
ncbi:MAG: 3'-5' exonuclease [Myxococcota bacterium]